MRTNTNAVILATYLEESDETEMLEFVEALLAKRPGIAKILQQKAISHAIEQSLSHSE